MLPGKSKMVVLGAALGSALVAFAVAPLAAVAGEGNANYLGFLSSTAPSGYTPSPAWYSHAFSQNSVTFQFNVTNLTAQQQSMSLELSLDRILTYQNMNVGDGQPGVFNGAVVDGQFDPAASTQVQDPNPTFIAFSIGPNATEAVHMSRGLSDGCGYYQVDVAKAGMKSEKGLVGFAIRVLGCTTTSPSPSPSPSPGVTPFPSPSPAGGGVGATNSPSPTSTGAGLGSTAGTGQGAVLASTGSTSPLEVIGATLLAFGALVLITGLAWRRREA